MRADESAEGSRQQDAQQDAAEYGTDHAAALLRRSEMSSEGHEEMNGRAHHTDGEAREREPDRIASRRRESERDGRADQHKRDQRAPLFVISERNEKEHAESGADLSEHCHQANFGDRKTKRAGDVREERLNVIDIGDDDAGAGGHEPDSEARNVSRKLELRWAALEW